LILLKLPVVSIPGENTFENLRKPLMAELRVYFGASQEKVLYGFSVDMSTKGLFLKTTHEFSVNENVMLSFTLPDVNKIVNCKARVAWLNAKCDPPKPELPTGVGLQFLDLSEEYLQSILSLLRHDAVIPVNTTEE
jgi:uncharacterized protein (TIGR02266 family)